MNINVARPHPSDAVAALPFNALYGMRVCFINMPLRESAKPNTPPQGPGLLAARLRQYGAEVSIIDLNAYRITDKLSRARGLSHGRHLTHAEAHTLIEAYFNKYGEPHVIGLSGKITTLKWQQWTARTCRTRVPKAFIISGGGLATEFREGLFNWVPELDSIGHSEGDDIMVLCVNDVKHGRGQRVYHGDRPRDLDVLPFAAWDLLEEDPFGTQLLEGYIATPVWGMGANNSSAAPFVMKRSLTTVSSRGCPHACGFCFRGAQGERNWGIRSPANLRSEAEWLIDTYGVDFIGFPDDNFAVSPKRCQALPEAFAGLNFRWGTHTRLDECTPDRLVPMAEAGCVYIGVGAESASKSVLYRMVKGGHIVRKKGVERLTKWQGYEFPTTMMEGIYNCRKVGIHTNATWIMAYPGETLEDLKTSVAFIKWQEDLYTTGLKSGSPERANALSSVNRRMFTATAYPGTTLFADHKVKELLGKHFGISFNADGTPICDDKLRWYVEELDDATKVLHGPDGAPLNYSDMPEDVFLQAREYADTDRIEKILEM